MKILPKKSLGQNFLIDNEVLNQIADLGKIKSNDIILEVGPGTGNLTEKIIKKKPKKLIVVEKDKNLTIFLKKKFNNNIEIINDDILSYNQEIFNKGFIMTIEVQVRNNNVEKAMRVLKKKLQKEGVFREMKENRYFEKPSAKRSRKKAEGTKRVRKNMLKRFEREGY